ncbi:MAG: hypothetical protein ACR2PG_08705 [Hyphomicrobiaceae bacterium]
MRDIRTKLLAQQAWLDGLLEDKLDIGGLSPNGFKDALDEIEKRDAEIERLQANLGALQVIADRANQKWQPIESAPTNMSILVRIGKDWNILSKSKDGSWKEAVVGGRELKKGHEPKAWMPLPQPPEGK